MNSEHLASGSVGGGYWAGDVDAGEGGLGSGKRDEGRGKVEHLIEVICWGYELEGLIWLG